MVRMIGDWIPRGGTIDAPELPDTVKDQAQAMAGLSDTTLTADRLAILATAAREVEDWTGRVLWQATGGARTSVCELEVLQAPAEIPACYLLPQAAGVAVAVTAVDVWNDAQATYTPATHVARPGGRLRLDALGIYRITATLDPGADPHPGAVEGLARLFGYREVRRPTAQTMAASEDGPTPPRLQGAVMKSGAGEALRYLRGAI